MKTQTAVLKSEALIIGAVSLAVFAACVLVAAPAYAASDYLLKLDGVKGEVTTTTAEPSRATTEVKVETNTAGTATIKTTPITGDPDFDLKTVSPTTGDPDFDLKKKTEATQGSVGDVDRDGKADDRSIVPSTTVRSGDDGDDTQKGGKVEHEWKVEEGESVAVSAVEVRGWDAAKKQEFLAAKKSFAEIKSQQDLQNFARGVLLEDENIKDVQFNPKELQVEYKATGKLLGLIPISFTERVIASGEDGAEVDFKVKLPWYGFLLSPDVDPEEIAKAAKDKHKETIEINSWSWGASNAGSLFTSISNVLKTKHDTVKNSISNVR